MSIWASADLARAYADVRSGLSESIRSVWGEAFRDAVPVPAPRRLLDLGCGTGRFTVLLGQVFGAPVVGVDGSPAMLRERLAAPGLPIAFASADATALPFRAASFDVALLSMIYHLLSAAGVAGPSVGELSGALA
jgi:ubiquinone/menaquinone biosynthesis C-methylase UbiE